MNEKQKIKAYANWRLFSDVKPFEVVKIISDKTVEVRAMNIELVRPAAALGVGGFSACYNNSSQEWKITSNPDAPIIRLRWSETKQRWQYADTCFVMSDEPYYFYDYNF